MLTKDCWVYVANFLEPSQIFELRATCKLLYRVCEMGLIRDKISGGMIGKYKPNKSQWLVIEDIVRNRQNRVWITGAVGVGKSVVAMISALKIEKLGKIRNIIIIVPPNLIEQWAQLLEKQFGQKAYIMHSYNKEYPKLKFKNQNDIPTGLILTTLIIFNHKMNLFDENSILIIDECRTFYNHFIYQLGINANVSKTRNYKNYTIENIYDVSSNTLIEKMVPITEYIYKLPVPNMEFKKHDDIVNLLSYPFLRENQFESEIIYHGKKIKRLKFRYHKNPQGLFLLEKSPKFLCVVDILRKIPSHEKVILFDTTIDYLPYLANRLEKNGFKTYLFTTDEGPILRMDTLEKFRRANEGILLTSYKMMGEGHNLPEANHIIYYSACSSKNIKMQTIGRCQRFHQKRQVYLHILCSSPIDFFLNFPSKYEYIFEKATLRPKSTFIKSLLGGYGFWSYTNGYIPTSIDISAILTHQQPLVNIGSIGHTSKNNTEFQVLAISENGKLLTIRYQGEIQYITLRHNNKYYRRGLSTSSTEYYF